MAPHIKGAMAQPVELVQQHLARAAAAECGRVQVPPVRLPGQRPGQAGRGLAHSMQRAGVALPDTHHPGSICAAACHK